ncbi:uncharacterized protein LOC105695692 [Orussus abietinus]|uniref:uncharacterized protein LOC105695692 n=1 Tax=Orussus abietinus TaxID=222816 RepID=UPI0006265A7C|nr:uncharacterized protein LOC105695692 [Orussus abietinus]
MGPFGAVGTLALLLALSVGSGVAINCYMCNSVTNAACGKDLDKAELEPVECTAAKMNSWYAKTQDNPILKSIAHLFEVDTPKHYQTVLPDMSCAKMDLTVGGREVTIRSCQTAKTESIDPCKVISSKLSESVVGAAVASVDYCGLCEHDGCNGARALSALPLLLSVLVSALLVGSLGTIAP